MGNLFTSLLNTANALGVYSRALETTENNVVNASTPGYARQVQVLEALPFDVSVGRPGGVAAGPVVSTRSAFAEEAVRTQQWLLGYEEQTAKALTPLESYFTVAADGGIAASLDSLWNSFSQLSMNPNDRVSRQDVINQALQVAQAFQHTATGLSTVANSVDQQTRAAVDAINELAANIAHLNTQRSANAYMSADAGIDATMQAALEELSQYVDFKALQQPDGSVTVYMGGQTPLVMGDSVTRLQADLSTPQTTILDSQGRDITSQVQSGSLAALIAVKNTVLPSYTADLNSLAQGVADQVNTTLSNGIDQAGEYPAMDLFTYDATIGTAATMDINPLTPEQIAAALPEAPSGNGNALALAKLADAKLLDGYSFAQFYGELAARIGRDLSSANTKTATGEQLLEQTQTLRSQISGVSLDKEAANLIAYQRAYESTSKLLSVLNDLTGTIMEVIR